MPTIQALGRWEPENPTFKVSVSYTVDHGQTGIWVTVILSRKKGERREREKRVGEGKRDDKQIGQLKQQYWKIRKYHLYQCSKSDHKTGVELTCNAFEGRHTKLQCSTTLVC